MGDLTGSGIQIGWNAGTVIRRVSGKTGSSDASKTINADVVKKTEYKKFVET